ncbi:MAG: rhomboid family intramembrane serine protease [Polyangiaceae bacterium]|nr:rhomboid family intramembrane serine protease [Polyangiaceae bacterium]
MRFSLAQLKSTCQHPFVPMLPRYPDLSLQDVVHSLLLDAPPAQRPRLLRMGERHAELALPDGGVAILFLNQSASPQQAAALRRTSQAISERGGALVLLGGGSAEQKELEEAKPVAPRRLVRLIHLSDSGEVRSFFGPLLRSDPLVQGLRNLRVANAQEQEKLAGFEREDRQAEKEALTLQAELSQRLPVATVGLALTLILGFLLQSRLPAEAAIEAGVLVGPLVRQGEYFRLFSYGLLHGDLIHLGMNVAALWVLGSSLEKLIGPWRLCSIYLVSLLGSGVFCVYFSQGAVIGASGAIFGLFGSQLMLAFGRPQLLPPSVAQRWKRMLLANLLFIVAFSLLPGISFAGHLGGALAGAAWTALGRLRMKELKDRRRIYPEGVLAAIVLLAAFLSFSRSILSLL